MRHGWLSMESSEHILMFNLLMTSVVQKSKLILLSSQYIQNLGHVFCWPSPSVVPPVYSNSVASFQQIDCLCLPPPTANQPPSMTLRPYLTQPPSSSVRSQRRHRHLVASPRARLLRLASLTASSRLREENGILISDACRIGDVQIKQCKLLSKVQLIL